MIEVRRTGLFTGIEFKKRDTYIMLAMTAVFGIFFTFYLQTYSLHFLIISLSAAIILFYIFLNPIIQRDQKKSDINSNIPFFVTALTTLSVSDSNRIEILDILSKKEKLGMLREDLAKIVNLVRNWKRGLSEAAMFLAQKSPSEVFADFLARFAHALDSGQDFYEFVKTESDTVMSNFETAYMSALYTFDLYKDMYVSLLLAFAFLIAFIMIMPVLVPMNMTVVLALSLLLVGLGESMLVYGIKVVLPNDPIWHDTGIKTDFQESIRQKFMIAAIIAMCLLTILVVTGYVYKIPFYFAVSAIVTPFAWPSILGSRAEASVAKKDEMFGSFIRALSGSAAARGNIIIDALKAIVLHDFGTLTRDIGNLYKRLTYRINSVQAWKSFSADTGSHLIEVFSESFVESIELGANSAEAGDVIAKNFDKVIRMRKRRHSAVSSYVGVLYGITGGLAFSLAISFGVLEIINKIFSTFSTSTITNLGIFLGQPSAEIFVVELFIMAILFVHSAIGGMALKVADGGKMAHGLHHVVIMMWIVSFVVYGTLMITNSLLNGTL